MSDGQPLYSVETWDTERQAFTPQIGVEKSLNLTWAELRQTLRRLKSLGYSAHRRRDSDGTHDDNDMMVLIERTNGSSKAAILQGWER